jgi:hypothetical protein
MVVRPSSAWGSGHVGVEVMYWYTTVIDSPLFWSSYSTSLSIRLLLVQNLMHLVHSPYHKMRKNTHARFETSSDEYHGTQYTPQLCTTALLTKTTFKSQPHFLSQLPTTPTCSLQVSTSYIYISTYTNGTNSSSAMHSPSSVKRVL